MAFMPWNFDTIKSLYSTTGRGFINRVDNRINLNPPVVANKIRELVRTAGADPDSDVTLQKARKATANQSWINTKTKPFMSPTFGYVAQWISEVAGGDDLAALLRHANEFLHPAWDKGGLYYPRCDASWDADGNWVHVDPYTGNAAIGYARLNVKEGQKKMFDEPWTQEYVKSAPWVDGFGLDDGIDCLRGIYDPDEQAMVMTLRTWDGAYKVIDVKVHNLPVGVYQMYVGGVLRSKSEVATVGQSIKISIEMSDIEVDIIVLRAK
jgi:hypothetical protein